MKKWYKESYFNGINWILENFDKLNLSADEALVLMLIELANRNNRALSYDYLRAKLGYDNNRIDSIIASLAEKKYLSIKPSKKGISFDISMLYEFDPEAYTIAENHNIYNIAEEFFSRPLSSTELQKISDLCTDFGDNKVIDAFRTAEAYRKRSLAYVETVLNNEKKF